MKKRDIALIVPLIFILAIPMFNGALASVSSTKSLSLSANISQPTTVNIDSDKTIATNHLSLGMMLDVDSKFWIADNKLQQLSSEANFKLIRLFDTNMDACLSWNDSSKTGTFDWTKVDSLVSAIFSTGAEPLIVLGYFGPAGIIELPPGMEITSTGLPSPLSYAAYVTQWVNHFNQTGANVRYYELFNEPWWYFTGTSDWTQQPDYTKLAHFRDVLNQAQSSIVKENTHVLIGFDGSNRKFVLDWWLSNNGCNLGFASFHKYDEGIIGDFSDSQMFNRAETFMINTDDFIYGISDLKQTYFNARGATLQVLNSESNFDSAYDGGTDPAIQQLSGTVWYALKLRAEMLSGLDYDVYYSFASGQAWQQAHGIGLGFGMVNLDNDGPYYPYYVSKMVGSNLAVNDKIVSSVSSAPNLESIAWIHNNELNVLVINKANTNQSFVFQGVNKTMAITQLDNSISYLTPAAQTYSISSMQSISLNGYAVVLAKTSLSS